MKVCSKCKISKPVSEFNITKYHGLDARCRDCTNKQQRHYYATVAPWIKTLTGIKLRCKRRKYLKDGIKNYLTLEELKYLWFRDKGYLLKRPSIDRIDNNKDYTFDNCQYIELRANLRGGLKRLDLWGKYNDRCIVCGTTERKHYGNEMCNPCYLRKYRRDKGITIKKQ